MNKLHQYFINVKVASVNFAMAFAGDYIPRPARSYGFNLAVAFDEFGNAITGGDPGETISSRSAKARNNGRVWGCILCKFLHYVAIWIFRQTGDHCDNSLNPTEGSKAVIPDGD